MKHVFTVGSFRTPLAVKVSARGNNYLAEVWIGENSVDAQVIVAQSDEAMRRYGDPRKVGAHSCTRC